uniref:K Homology domain-containing protein n=1 Tax=Panagrolaimus davidi TaxID=227884 RepID=A0A914QW76_9BILA
MINNIVKLYPTAGATVKDEKIVLSYSKVIKIPSDKCGFIVGENGEILKNLQLKYNVEMKIICQRVSRGTKLLHITGSTRNVKDAYEKVENIINDISSTALVVPREAVGPIMGKCGQNLMWFSSKSGCKINLEPLESPNATEQSAILHGTVEQIANAIHMISKLLRYCSKNVEKHSGYFHPLLQNIAKNMGIKSNDFSSYASTSKFYASTRIEKFYNLTLPAWITDSLWEQYVNGKYVGDDYLYGNAGFGESENSELIMLKGGLLLKTMISNMDTHDTTINAFLRTLQAKQDILGYTTPDYAAVVLIELWKNGNGEPYIKARYIRNVASQPEPITKFIYGCKGEDNCSLNDFKIRSHSFIPDDIIKACEKL